MSSSSEIWLVLGPIATILAVLSSFDGKDNVDPPLVEVGVVRLNQAKMLGILLVPILFGLTMKCSLHTRVYLLTGMQKQRMRSSHFLNNRGLLSGKL